jgi:DNA polymerase-3 subunit alpha
LDSVAKIPDLTAKARKLGMSSLAITDHGNICGWLKFYDSCVDAKDSNENPLPKIKPIFGIEAYICEDAGIISSINNKIDELEALQKTSQGPLFDNWETDPEQEIEKLKELKKKHRKANHVILLAKNKAGFKNILKLSSYGFQQGFYGKPRIDMKVLEQYKDGLVVLSGCLGGLVARNIMNQDFNKAEYFLKEYKRIFADDFYLEFQLHDIPEQIAVNKKLIEYAKKYSVEPIVTQDVHYVEKEDVMIHEIVIKLRNSQKASSVTKQTSESVEDDSSKTSEGNEKVEEGDGYFFTTRDLYFKSYDEMKASWKSIHSYMPEDFFDRCIKNTLAVDEKVEFIDVRNPKPILPEYNTGSKTAREFIMDIIKKSAKDKLSKVLGSDEDLKSIYNKRIKEELDTICDLGFEQYFLIEWDLMNWCKNNGIMTGPGRGSAAGSLVAYLLDITQLDPIEHKLLFSRFINKSRSSARYKLEFPEFPVKRN